MESISTLHRIVLTGMMPGLSLIDDYIHVETITALKDNRIESG